MLVMEQIPLGNLERWVQNAGGTLPEKDVVEIAAQMFRGLRDMHDARFAHRDLKPEVR
jgi:serine/threonine protein kinase